MTKKPQEVIEFYQSLEALKSLNVWNISKELMPCDNIKSTVWRKRIMTERKILFHNLNDGVLESNVQSTNRKGQIIKVIKFSKAEITFLAKRLSETTNAWLASRYSHILWQETKNNGYAEIAIDRYIDSVNMIKSAEALEINSILPAIMFISQKTKKRTDVVKKLINELIASVPKWFKFTMLSNILKQNFLKPIELAVIADQVFEWLEKEISTSYFTNKQSLEVCLLLFDKIKRQNDSIYELLARNEDLIIAEHEDESFVKLTATTAKAKYLKKAKKITEYEKTLEECTRLKQTISLAKTSIPLDEEFHDMFNQYLRQKSDIIISWSTNDILSYFSSCDELIPDPIEIDEVAKASLKNSIYNLASVHTFDINGNTKHLNEEDKFEREKLQAYIIANNIQVYTLFLRVFIDCMLMGKLNYYKIYAYLEDHTWYGYKFKQGLSHKEDDTTSCLTLLAPGIQSYLGQFELSVVMNTNKVNNFVLCIDSMTLKFEGALRDFIRLSGGTTMAERKGEMQEQLLEDLLEHKITKQYFSEKDITFFKFTFTKKGKNIRNNVAHSFMEFSDYNLQVASQVFFCLLRLGKYTFENR